VRTEPGWQSVSDTDLFDASVVRIVNAVADGSERVISASEPWGRLNERRVVLRAITLNADDQVASVLGVGPDGKLAGYSGGGSVCPPNSDFDCVPTALENSLLVLNADQARVFSVGDGKDTLTQYQIGSLFVGPYAEATEFPLDPGGRPAEVLAGALRLEDSGLYVLDREAGAIRLRRWRHDQSGFVTLASWTNALRGFDQYWLSPGDFGDLVLTATRRQPAQTVVVHLTVAGGKVSVAGSTALPSTMVTEPFAGPYSVQLLVGAAGGPEYRNLAFRDMKGSIGSWHAELRPAGRAAR
jgi:hypothetical protein